MSKGIISAPASVEESRCPTPAGLSTTGCAASSIWSSSCTRWMVPRSCGSSHIRLQLVQHTECSEDQGTELLHNAESRSEGHNQR